MSILSQLKNGKITLGQAVTEAEQWAESIVAHSPALSTAVNNSLNDVKAAASTAVILADSAVDAEIQPVATGVETGLDAALAKLTGGVSVPFNGFINDGIDNMASAVKAEADAWALKAKAQLAASPSAKPAS